MHSARKDLTKDLQAQLRRLAEDGSGCVATGSLSLDVLLAGGIRQGALVEWLGDTGGGATSLALAVARQACQNGQTLVVIDPHRRFYPPAAGNILPMTLVTYPGNEVDQEWTAIQALRCPAIGAVLWWPERLTERTFRRLQLAAESGRSLGLIVRGTSAIREPSWAEMRLLVRSLPEGARRRFQVEIVRFRGASGRSVEVEISSEGLLHDAHPVHSVSELAAATPPQRTSPTQAPRRRRV